MREIVLISELSPRRTAGLYAPSVVAAATTGTGTPGWSSSPWILKRY